MSKNHDDLIASARSVSSLKAHLVLVTKYRRPLFNSKMLLALENIVKDLLSKWNCKCIEFNGEENHIHLIFQYTPQIQLSKLVNNLKTVSSRYLKKDFPDRFTQFYWKDALWSSSYFISSCGGVTVDVLKKYVQEQDRPA
ncbi:MAG: IS200/IS605 family transposase [Xenococcaceae cyanobacterium]